VPHAGVITTETLLLPKHETFTCVPEVAVGKAFTVTVQVAVHPLLFVKVIVLVASVTPVITPPLVTVATLVLLDTYGLLLAAVPEPVNVVVLLIQTV
jgi:hypothetical protein